MPKSKRQKLRDVVPHPRYGEVVVPSGTKAEASEVRDSFWRYCSDTIFPESAIKADTSRQNFTTVPRGYYVDTLKECRTCGRPFIFFAKEQQHWYEVLGFYIDADCVHCPECRQSDRQLCFRFKRYSENVGRSDLADQDLMTLIEDAVFLWRAGMFRDEQRLRRLRNLARQRIPGRAAINRIDEVISELKNN